MKLAVASSAFALVSGMPVTGRIKQWENGAVPMDESWTVKMDGKDMSDFGFGGFDFGNVFSKFGMGNLGDTFSSLIGAFNYEKSEGVEDFKSQWNSLAGELGELIVEQDWQDEVGSFINTISHGYPEATHILSASEGILSGLREHPTWARKCSTANFEKWCADSWRQKRACVAGKDLVSDAVSKLPEEMSSMGAVQSVLADAEVLALDAESGVPVWINGDGFGVGNVKTEAPKLWEALHQDDGYVFVSSGDQETFMYTCRTSVWVAADGTPEKRVEAGVDEDQELLEPAEGIEVSAMRRTGGPAKMEMRSAQKLGKGKNKKFKKKFGNKKKKMKGKGKKKVAVEETGSYWDWLAKQPVEAAEDQGRFVQMIVGVPVPIIE